MRSTADVVIIGGGVIGTSIAYHLAAMGAEDILVLEKEPMLAKPGCASVPMPTC